MNNITSICDFNNSVKEWLIKDMIIDVFVWEIFLEEYFEKYYSYFLNENWNFDNNYYDDKLSYIKKMASENIYLFDISEVLLEENISLKVLKDNLKDSIISDIIYILWEKDNFWTHSLRTNYDLLEETEILDKVKLAIFKDIMTKKIWLWSMIYKLRLNEHNYYIKKRVLKIILN